MKSFTLFFGASGQLGTTNITNNSQYEIVVNTVNQLRDHLLKEEVLRQPFLHIFSTCYHDGADFPHDLAPCTPIADQVSNMSKIRDIRSQPPTDNDVVDFLTNSFPDLYLAPGDFGPEGVSWGETWSGRGEAEKEKIAINCQLVQLWLQSVNIPMAVGPSRLWFMFIAVFLHELGHSALVWYGKGACDSPQLGTIERESGNYVEKAFFGAITCAEFEFEPMRLVEIGVMRDELFYPIDNKMATTLTELDASNGLPLLNISTLSPAPPATFGRIRAKFSQAITTKTHRGGVLPAPKKLSATRARPLLKNDKIRVMPSV